MSLLFHRSWRRRRAARANMRGSVRQLRERTGSPGLDYRDLLQLDRTRMESRFGIFPWLPICAIRIRGPAAIRPLPCCPSRCRRPRSTERRVRGGGEVAEVTRHPGPALVADVPVPELCMRKRVEDSQFDAALGGGLRLDRIQGLPLPGTHRSGCRPTVFATNPAA